MNCMKKKKKKCFELDQIQNMDDVPVISEVASNNLIFLAEISVGMLHFSKYSTYQLARKACHLQTYA